MGRGSSRCKPLNEITWEMRWLIKSRVKAKCLARQLAQRWDVQGGLTGESRPEGCWSCWDTLTQGRWRDNSFFGSKSPMQLEY